MDIDYLVSGGGGAKPHPIVRGSADLYQDPGFPNYNYIKFVEDGYNFQATMVRVADPGRCDSNMAGEGPLRNSIRRRISAFCKDPLE